MRLVTVAAMLAVLAVGGLAFKTLHHVKSERVLCPVIDVDGGVVAQELATGGSYNSIACTNTGSEPVYFGGSSVTTSSGFPVCTDSSNCAGSAWSLDTQRGQVYCTTATATHDGGTPIRCIYGK